MSSCFIALFHVRKWLAGLVFLCLLGAGRSPAQPSGNPPATHVLFLTADGFRTDYIEWYEPANLKRLIKEGVRVMHATNVFPTVTTPNMTSLVTGAYPRTTGIAGNSQYVKEEDRIKDKLRDNHAETIAETLRKAGWKTAGVNHFMLAGRGTDFYASVGYDDSEKTTDAILDVLKNKKAQFVGAIYGAADHAGHRFGPQSAQVKEAVLGIDKAIGRLVAGLKELGLYESTLIAFTADHGMSAFESKQAAKEPAQALRQAGFKVATTPAELNAQTDIVVLDAGVRMVYFRAPLNEIRKTEARSVLSKIEGTELLERQALDKLGCHDNRSGDLIVSPLPGYTIRNAGKTGGQHGRFAERNPILFFHGPGFRKGATVESGRTVDVVPTLLRLVKVAPAKTVEGRALENVFE